jgi:hypothetical protein
MTKYFLLFVLVTGTCFSQQDLKVNFVPLKSSGALPDVFTQNIRNVIKDDITELNKQKDNNKSLKKTYLTEANYEIEKIVKSGNTLINDEVTTYLNKVVDVVLKNNPTLRNELHIYTLKSPVVNAYSYDKGYIFINIGLIAQAETEAQLAYILCHEICHYTKKHHINGYVDTKKIERNGYDGKTKSDVLIEKCQYSKEKESEADIEGFKMFEQTNYNLKQAEKSFDVLQYAHLPFELIEFKKSFFESENYVIPKGYFLKEVSSIRNNSNEDDTKHTHPNTAKRKVSIAELIGNRDNTNKVDYVLGKEQFQYIRDLARMELCRLYLIRRDYPNALYAAYILANKYPENQYVKEVIAKCLYAISLHGKGIIKYNSDSYLEDGFPSYSNIESYPQQLYHFIGKMPTNEWTIMSLNYVYRLHKKHPSNKQISAYSDSLLKLISEINWGITDFVRVKKKPLLRDTLLLDSINAKIETKSKTDLIANLQKENTVKIEDTVYYKDAFVDLFMNDTEFSSKFPAVNSLNTQTNSGFSTYNSHSTYKNKNGESIKAKSKIEKVLLLEPFYLKVDDSQPEEAQYTASDEKQENFIVTVNDCAQKQNFELVTLDPGLITASEVDKINDYSVINDWFSEKFDAPDKDRNPIFNTNNIDDIISKYGTQYVMKIGIVNYRSKSGRKRTYYYGFIYDIKTNDIIYKKYETFRDKDTKDLLNAKVYQTFYELKHSK